MAKKTHILSNLKQACETGTACYLLVDPILGDVMQGSDFPDSATAGEIASSREKTWGRPVNVVELHHSIQLEPVYYPYLVPLDGADDPWLEASLDIALAERQQSWKGGLAGSGEALHKIGGWLKTTLYGKELAVMLSGWMRLNTAVRVPERYLRLGDPRVLALLRTVLGTDVLQAGMGRLKEWLYLDAYSALQKLDNPEAHRKDDNSDAVLPRLDRAQWEKMSTGTLVHGAIARAYGQSAANPDSGNVPGGDVPYTAAISAALRFAVYLERGTASPTKAPLTGKIRDQNDVAAAVTLSLLNAMWDTHPDVRQRLSECTAEETLATCCMDIHERLQRPVEMP